MKADDALVTGSTWFRAVGDRLSVRFAMVLALSLLPLGVVSLVQTWALQQEIQQRTQAALLGETLRSAAGEIGVIRNAQGVVATLAAAMTVVPPVSACIALMQRTKLQVPTATLVAYLPKDGRMVCASNGQAHDFAGSALFQSVAGSQAPNFVVNRQGPISGTSVLGVSHPVFDPAGTYLGFVSVSLPHAALNLLDTADVEGALGNDHTVVFWTFDRAGEVLTASSGLDAVQAQLPTSRPMADYAEPPENVFQDTSGAGKTRTYAVVPIVPGQLYLMSSWEKKRARLLEDSLVWPYLPPITMWIVGLIVAGLASERLVTRHIRVLSHSILSFARGDRGLRHSDLDTAPIELRDVGAAFQSMTHSITRGEAELENSIHQKEVLLREVHHRVKNNLQLIASIMNIQMRKAIAPEAKVLLKGLQDRVMSLATIHRGLYQTSGLADVRMDELFRDIVRQIVNLATVPGRKFAVSLDVEELHLTPDQAVPLSLLLTEAMTNAMKYAGTEPGQPVAITVRLRRDDAGRQLMEVINSLGAVAPTGQTVPPMSTSTGLGEQLLTAFAQQVGGTLEREITDHSFRLSVRFEPKSLAVEQGMDDVSAPDDVR